VNELLIVAATVVAGISLLVAIGTAWALSRLRMHHRQLAASFEIQQREISSVAAQSRDEVREVERRGAQALVERFALHDAIEARRDRVRAAVEEVVAAAAVGRLGAQPTRVLVEHLHRLERELHASGTTGS
jgi:hypothetical protein